MQPEAAEEAEAFEPVPAVPQHEERGTPATLPEVEPAAPQHDEESDELRSGAASPRASPGNRLQILFFVSVAQRVPFCELTRQLFFTILE